MIINNLPEEEEEEEEEEDEDPPLSNVQALSSAKIRLYSAPSNIDDDDDDDDETPLMLTLIFVFSREIDTSFPRTFSGTGIVIVTSESV